jgi:hypothetical protein
VESYDRLEVLFWTIFDKKSGRFQKIISRKQKIWHLQNVNHEFLTYQSVFLQNFKKSKTFFFGLEHCRKKWTTDHPVYFLSQNFFGHIF